MSIRSASGEDARILIAAFQGWSNAGDATTEAVAHLTEMLDNEVIHTISGEQYCDLQLNRPRVSRDEDGKRIITWPDTKLWGPVRRPELEQLAGIAELAELEGLPVPEGAVEAVAVDRVTRLDGTAVTELFVLSGVEPTRDWSAFSEEIVDLVDVWDIDVVVFLGALFADAPHTRPIVTTLSSEDPALREALEAEKATYEGPAGVLTAVDLALNARDVPTVALWAQVPHYVHSAPSPKATLALLDKLEEILDIFIPRGDLLDLATDWENNINNIASVDEEMSRYITRLEEARDELHAADGAGDALALEFERFLGADQHLLKSDSSVSLPQAQAESDSGTDATEPSDDSADGITAETDATDLPDDEQPTQH
ncbi:PAC2 family protein [Leucobacter sp. CX42]|uniref:PAC2 family protein n=1 Tax=unclassified Leucobacter TaxID=2621730 RepID=UPI0033409167